MFVLCYVNYGESKNLMDKIEETMLEYRGKKFVVIEPGGNNGDRLIHMGMEKKLELGINYIFLQYRESPIYYGPWQGIRKILSVASKLSNGLEMAVRKLDSEVYEKTQRARAIHLLSLDVTHLIRDPNSKINFSEFRDRDCVKTSFNFRKLLSLWRFGRVSGRFLDISSNFQN